MKNTTKRIIATASAMAVISAMAGAANAQGNEIYINNQLLANSEVKVIDNAKFIPLRAICENLGFEVNWIEESRTIELVKLPVYVTCSPDRDGYTFARTAPMLLGSAPHLIDNLTYVPMNFIDEILQGEITDENGNLHITYGEVLEVTAPEITGTVCEIIYEDEKPVQLVLGDIDDVESQKVLNLNEELQARVLELGIEVGTAIVATTEEAMTMSIPPQYIAISLELEVKEGAVLEGTVCDLIYEDDKLVQLVIGDKEDVNTQSAFNLSEEIAAKVIEDGITIGSYVIVETTDIATMSIPPQFIAVSVTAAERENHEVSGTVCELVYEEDKLVQIIIGDKEDVYSQTAFNLTEEIAAKAIEDGIEVGSEITVVTTDLMTMSIPPQMIPVSVTINK